jgi:hypothetical protein
VAASFHLLKARKQGGKLALSVAIGFEKHRLKLMSYRVTGNTQFFGYVFNARAIGERRREPRFSAGETEDTHQQK